MLVLFGLCVPVVLAAEGNIAQQKRVIFPGEFTSPVSIVDGDLSTSAVLPVSAMQRKIVVDLGGPVYLDTITVYSSPATGERDLQVGVAPPDSRVGISTDILNWHTISTYNIVSKQVSGDMRADTFLCEASAARYILVRCSAGKTITLNEIEVYASSNYTYDLQDISVEAMDTKAILSFRTTREASAQVIYGTNYDYLYEKQLKQTIMDFAYTKDHSVVITDLKPQTSYRFQVRATDHLNNVIQSDFILFTTKGK